MDHLFQTNVFGLPLAFLWTAFLIELTPGPNMSYLAVLSIADGRRAGFAAVAGIAAGLLIVGLIAAFGLAAVISQSPTLYNILRGAGVVYLVWLAYDIWQGSESDTVQESKHTDRWSGYFQRGLISNLLNPKAAVFYVGVLPPFVDATRPVLQQTIALSIAYVSVATLIHLVIVVVAARARIGLQNSITITALRRVLAGSVLIIAFWLAWSTRAAPL